MSAMGGVRPGGNVTPWLSIIAGCGQSYRLLILPQRATRIKLDGHAAR
jgi:hypothetical protein